MITSSKVQAKFTQTGGSCVLASYAIAHNYFTSQPIRVCFEDYCRHFNLPFSNWHQAEQKYAAHFDGEWRRRKCTGYEVILELHNHSSEGAFVTGRKRFASSFYAQTEPHRNYIENCLRAKEAILNITFEIGVNYHSVTAFADATGLVSKDTTRQGLINFGALDDLGNLRDGLLHVQK